jgi:hypothetical protein
MRIIDARIRDLVRRIDAAKSFSPTVDLLIRELVFRLHESCSRPDVVASYAQYANETSGDMAKMPLDAEGYVVSFDPLEDEEGFMACWRRYGIVAGKQVVSPTQRRFSIGRMHDMMRRISDGKCLLADPATWHNMPTDDAGVPIISRGFFEVYHDDALAQLRQAVRVYLHFVMIWGRADIWTSFDRLGIKLPDHPESKALPLHVDQNPKVHPGFRTVQGVLALKDCPAERGTFQAVPGSKLLFGMYGSMAKNAGEYVELDLSRDEVLPVADRAQVLPVRGGDIITWDSRTTHANTRNISNKARMVAYIAAGPAAEDDAQAVAAREDAFATGVGSNVRTALMHASKRPRYSNPLILQQVRAAEKLTLLGRLLYGKQRYADIIK